MIFNIDEKITVGSLKEFPGKNGRPSILSILVYF